MEDLNNNSRRNFVKSILVAGIAIQFPWIQSCSRKLNEIPIPDNIKPLNTNSFQTIYRVFDILFPEDGNGPGAISSKADHYFIWILNDPNIASFDYKFLLQNLETLNKKSLAAYDENFHLLSKSRQEKIIADFSKEKVGKKWISQLITIILEATLLDPQYGVNPQQKGWKWLEHNPGFPRPQNKQLYPTILNKRNEI